jgi:uncharacterized protein YyaL (SSP411 family)
MNTNRLARERSPYLLQHAHNPVDWYPWCDEAFDRARREDKPVFLSIGYSACHWCHVMERESFESDETARVLNDRFVSIKVDREERPDIDQIYQLAHQVIAQRAGGWPLSMFLSHDRKPFFGGTYFPGERRYGMPSFREILTALEDAWYRKRSDVYEQAEELTRVVQRAMSTATARPGRIDTDALGEAADAMMARAEPTHGGFGRAPKFPNTMSLDVLLCAGATTADARAHDHVLLTLDRMARGGIHDQLGGGFARYSTDERWLVPHFEKMLYDNAQLGRLYIEGWRAVPRGADANAHITRARCRAVAADTFAYVLREMTDEATGLFYSAQDADSEGEEGRFFVWTPSEVERIAGADDARAVCAWFDVTDAGNFEHGRTVLWTPRAADDVARLLGIPREQLDDAIARAAPRMFAAREERPRPMRDDKCLASWNALMIGALAHAGATLDEPTWVAAANRALGAWHDRAWSGERLAHAVKNGEAYGTGYLDDYAGMACAAIDVYESTFAAAQLAFARAVIDAMLDLFADSEAGDLYYAPRDAEIVLGRPKELQDHAYPGGAGLAADALLRLATLTGVLRYRSAAERLLASVASVARESPMGFATLVRAIDRAARGAIEIVIVGEPGAADTRALLAASRSVYVPHRALVCIADEADGVRAGLDAALVRGRTRVGGAATAYVCRGAVCELPVTDAASLEIRLRESVRAAG